MDDAIELLEYCKNEKDILCKLSSLFLQYSFNQDIRKIAKSILSESVEIDLWEMESIINPEKFEFPNPDIGVVAVNVP